MKTIRNLDIFTIKPTLFANSQERYRNIVGFSFSLLYFFIIIPVSIIFSIEYLSRENIKVIQNEIKDEESFWSANDSPIIFQILDNFGNPYRNQDRIFNLSVFFIIDYTEVENNIYYENNYRHKLKLLNCSDVIIENTIFMQIVKNLKLNDKICLNPKEILRLNEIVKKFQYISSKNYVSIQISKCKNLTNINQNCFDKNIIDFTIENSMFKLDYIDYSIDHRNISYPYFPYWKTDTFSLSSKLLKFFKFFFKKFKYLSDIGVLFNKIETYEFTKFHDKIFDISILNDELDLIFKFDIYNADLSIIYIRYLKRFQTLIAELFAISKILIFLINFLIKKYIDIDYYMYISNFINLFENSEYSVDIINENVQYDRNPRKIVDVSVNKFIENKKFLQNFSSNYNLYNLNSSLNDLNYTGLSQYIQKNPIKQKQKIINDELITNNKFHSVFEDISKLKYGDVATNKNLSYEYSRKYNLDNITEINLKNSLKNSHDSYIHKKINTNNFQNDDFDNSKNNVHNFKVNNTINKQSPNDPNKNNFRSEINSVGFSHYGNKHNFSHSRNNNESKNKSFINMNSCISSNNIFNKKDGNISSSSIIKKSSLDLENFYKSKIKRLNLSLSEYFKKICFCYKNKKLKSIEIAVNYVKKKISVEVLIKKIHEIDKIQFILMDEHEINFLKNLKGPNINYVYSFLRKTQENINENAKENNLRLNYLKNSINKLSLIDELWKIYEF